MNADDTHAFDLKGLAITAASFLAAFVCGAMTWNTSGDNHFATIDWIIWIVLFAIVLACSYLMLRRLGAGNWIAAALSPFAAAAQFAAMVLVLLGLFTALYE